VWDCAAKPNDSLLPAAKKYPGFVEHQNVRLFRRDKAIYFVGRVHESVGPRILELGGRLEAAPFSIHHFGLAMDAETRARKNHFYRELGREKIREMPENAQARLELGIVEMDNFGNLPEALALFEQACKLDRKLGVAWFFRGLTLVKLESYSAALESLVQAEKQGHKTSLAAETQGDAEYNLKDYSRASQSYKIALQRSPGNASLESKLGLSLLRLGKTSEGMRKLQRALARNPAAGELHDRLILALVWLDLLAEAAEAAEVKLKMSDEVHARDFLRAASLWTQARNSEKTGEVLLAGLRRYPDHDLLLRALREAGLAPQTAEFTSSLKSGTSGG
ncbi:MAG: tetratricopeptide repeat protein, partial [Candidatus Acidiferrum sp.]